MNARIDSRRVHRLSEGANREGPVLYWMSRDQRVRDNWALLYAREIAARKKAALGVVFCLTSKFLGATDRHYKFMLGGLREIRQALSRKRIPFLLLIGAPEKEIVRFVRRHGISELVTDFSPLRISRGWKKAVADAVDLPIHEVDAHNIIPCRPVSDKQEYGAYTIRPKIQRLLPEFLTEFPQLNPQGEAWPADPPEIDWGRVEKSVPAGITAVPVGGTTPGEKAGRRCLKQFISQRLKIYHDRRNDPNADAESHLSPYLHFGQISAQRIALEIQKCDNDFAAQESFLEQLIVRRELADNFCLHNARYDSFDGFPEWARKTLNDHRRDIRPHIYSFEQLELGDTHDDLWNAAQMEMVHSGRLHNYLRMYWAKKILEWSSAPEEALASAIFLNDRYQFDGRDPNGYAGIAWSIGGVHDRPWGEREIFGKIRYMSYDGCRRKFDVNGYIERVNKTIAGKGR